MLGGGPAGSATALALGRRGVGPVLLVEAGDYRSVRIGESLPPEIRSLLENLGIWQDFVAEAHEPCLGSCSSWGSEAPGYNDFLFNPHGNGWHLDRRRFDEFLARKAVEGGVELWKHTRYGAVETCEGGGFSLLLETDGRPRRVSTGFVVDATGSNSRFARSLGIPRRPHDRLSYVASFLELSPASTFPRLTWLEAVSYGWWYAALLPEGRIAVAVASDPEVIKEKELYRHERWQASLEQTRHLAGRIAGCRRSQDPLIVRTAPSFLLERPWGNGWLAVGDAASSYDPISSQGVYKALLEGLEGAQAAAGWLAGESGRLEAYGRGVAERFAEYLSVRSFLYGLERRWPYAPFWIRRHERREAKAPRSRGAS